MHRLQRSVLVLCFLWHVPPKIYMTGSVRSWIHYIDLRSANGTQKEHMDLALGAKKSSVNNSLPLQKQWNGIHKYLHQQLSYANIPRY